METTLEVRWFVRGTPPLVVQHWFRLECMGNFKGWETRKDWYAYPRSSFSDRLDEFLPNLKPEEINLKLRQNNLELKIRRPLENSGLANIKSSISGKIEQWHKFDERELRDAAIFKNPPAKIDWISVDKKREQKIKQGVKSELTWLKINHESWWTIAFEMTQNDEKYQYSRFKKIVETVCQTYPDPQLSNSNSYGYSRWLLEFAPQAMGKDSILVDEQPYLSSKKFFLH